jgi:hypothetical protein
VNVRAPSQYDTLMNDQSAGSIAEAICDSKSIAFDSTAEAKRPQRVSLGFSGRVSKRAWKR